MAQAIPARLTPREGRRFAFPVGAVFLLLAGLSRWRGHTTAPWVLAGLGTVLLAAGLIFPGRLTPLYRGWMQLALLLSRVTTPVFMGLLYFVVLTPMGLLLRLFGRNPLKAREVEGGFWVTRTPRKDEAESLTRQF